jgi:hypothetical protein
MFICSFVPLFVCGDEEDPDPFVSVIFGQLTLVLDFVG